MKVLILKGNISANGAENEFGAKPGRIGKFSKLSDYQRFRTAERRIFTN